MEPMKPLREGTEAPDRQWQPSRLSVVMNLVLSAAWIVLATAFLRRDGFSWLTVILLIVASINFGSWSGDLLKRRSKRSDRTGAEEEGPARYP
jgi:hypothetical protein